ncbi:MAG: hypothetical protein FJ403_14460 [Verrucomicrobia bacterium]|nr:hypothetical protein [Verrucomicrobiota bacterium]
MTIPEKPLDPPLRSEASLEELLESYRSLRNLFHIVLVTLLVLTASFFLFLLREVSQIRRQTKELVQFVDNYERNNLPAMLEFKSKLQEFAKAYPDFGNEVLAKYISSTNAAVSGISTNAEPAATNTAGRIPVTPVK